jgi:hypothetical protein
MSVWVWLVYALAVARMTGLVVADDITRPGRDWIIDHLPARPVFAAVEELLTCPWCASMWLAAAAVPMAWHWGTRPWLLGPALVLTLSQVTGMTSTLGRPVTP